MFNDLPRELHQDDIERNAYNAAFYELGLRWHWDCETFDALKQSMPTAELKARVINTLGNVAVTAHVLAP